MSPWAAPHNPSMKYLFSTQAEIAKLTEEEYRGRCGHFDVLPIHLPADADPVKFLNFVQSRDSENGTNVYGRLLEMDAFLLARIAKVCGGSARVQMMGLAFLKDNSDNILTRLMRDMYEHEASRAFLVGGGLGEDAKALVDAATFCNHPMVYLVPGFHPTNVDNIKRNDFAVACFLSFTFGWLIRPNMARRAFERDPVFSAALAIQKAAHLQRIAGLGGKAQAASGQLAAKAAAGGKAQAASGQLAAKAAAGRKAQAASGQLAAKAAAGGKAQAASGQLAAKAAAGRKAQAASGQLAAKAAAGGKAQAASGQLAAKAAAGGKAQAASGQLAAKAAAGRASREMNPGGVFKAKSKYAVFFNKKRLGTYSPLEAARFVWNAAAREWNKTHANPSEQYALWELPPDVTAKFESRDPRWKEPSGVKKSGGKYAVCFNEKYIGTYSPLEAARFVWNAAAREWNKTHANPFEKHALWELSPDVTAKFESRDPRWKEPSGVKKLGDKYAVFFNKKRLGTYSPLEAARFVWNAAAREWNKTHANPFEKHALWELPPDVTAKFESRDPRWKEPSGVKKLGGKYAVCFNKKYIRTYPTLEEARLVWNDAAREWNKTHANPFEKYALFPSTPGDEAR